MTNGPGEQAESGDSQDDESKSKDFVESSKTPPTQGAIQQAKPATVNDADINGEIEEMVAATQAVMPKTAGSFFQRQRSHKRRQSKGDNVLQKMRAAMNHHLHSLANKKSNGKLFMPSPSSTNMEIRVNEGQYLMQIIIRLN